MELPLDPLGGAPVFHNLQSHPMPTYPIRPAPYSQTSQLLFQAGPPARQTPCLRGVVDRAFVFVALACLSLCASCGHQTGVLTTDSGFAARLRNEKVGIVSVNSSHLGPALAANGVAAASAPLWIGAKLSDSSNPQADYVARLNRDAVAAIDAELRKALAFQYVPALNPAIHFNNPDAIDNQTTIARAIASKGLRCGLGVEIDYGFITGFNKQMASKITWLLYDASGSKKIVIATVVSSEQRGVVFPNTKDAKFHDAYVTIAHKSAADFLSLLTDKAPRYQQELSVMKVSEFRSGSNRDQNIFR